MTYREAEERWPFGHQWRKPSGEIVQIVARWNEKLLVKQAGNTGMIWVHSDDADYWERVA